MTELRPVLFVVGVLCVTSGPLLMLCALVDLASDHEDWQVFVLTAVLVVGFGALLSTATWGGALKLTLRQGFLLTVLSWISLSFVGALPLYFSSAPMTFAGAIFESVSGFTTTGSTVLSGLDSMPPGLLLWRGLMQWVGGLGVIAMGIILLPFLRISGMQLFRMESSDVSEKATARIVVLLRQIAILYVFLTAFGVMALLALGVQPLDAVVHAFTSVATGGFSNHDASVGWFQSRSVEAVLLLLMFLGSLTFPLLIMVFHGRPQALFRDDQIRFFVKMLAVIIISVVAWRIWNTDVRPIDAIWSTLFNIVSIVTTTGYASDDYMLWGAFPVSVFFLITLLGGCTGSTSGGIKTYRLMILAGVMRNQILTRLQPHRVLRITYNDRIVDDEVVRSVSAFLWMVFLSLAFFTAAVAACGLDFVTSLSAAAQALANVGPGIGPIIGPAGNFSTLPDSALWILSAAMILGRLEIVVVLVVLSPAFWRR